MYYWCTSTYSSWCSSHFIPIRHCLLCYPHESPSYACPMICWQHPASLQSPQLSGHLCGACPAQEQHNLHKSSTTASFSARGMSLYILSTDQVCTSMYKVCTGMYQHESKYSKNLGWRNGSPVKQGSVQYSRCVQVHTKYILVYTQHMFVHTGMYQVHASMYLFVSITYWSILSTCSHNIVHTCCYQVQPGTYHAMVWYWHWSVIII